MDNYACPCCQQPRSLTSRGYACGVCYWIDEGGDPSAPSQRNGRLTLAVARQNYARYWVSSLDKVHYVLPPKLPSGEQPLPYSQFASSAAIAGVKNVEFGVINPEDEAGALHGFLRAPSAWVAGFSMSPQTTENFTLVWRTDIVGALRVEQFQVATCANVGLTARIHAWSAMLSYLLANPRAAFEGPVIRKLGEQERIVAALGEDGRRLVIEWGSSA